jgi:hypothetical protein
MALGMDGETAFLEGVIGVEEAETLLEWLQASPGRGVDLSGCDHLHAGVLQVLMALAPPIQGEPRDPFLARVMKSVSGGPEGGETAFSG